MEEKNVGIAQTLSVRYVTGQVKLRLNSSLMMSLGAGAIKVSGGTNAERRYLWQPWKWETP